MQFLGKFPKIVRWRPPPRELAAPPRGNPGSATGMNLFCCVLVTTYQSVLVYDWAREFPIHSSNGYSLRLHNVLCFLFSVKLDAFVRANQRFLYK